MSYTDDYTDDFLQFWRVYGRVPNQSKVDAFKAWNQTEEARPELGVLLQAVASYKAHVYEQRALERRRVPICHAATWLRQRRWESWVLDDDEKQESVPVTDQKMAAIKQSIGANSFDTWFRGAYIEGSTLFVPKQLHADRIRGYFYRSLDSVLGESWEVKISKEK